MIKRKSSYYIKSIVVPVFLLNWFACITSLIPDDSGEKLGFAISVELAIVFLMATMDNHITPSGNQKPALIMNIIIISNLILIISFFKTIFMNSIKRDLKNKSQGQLGSSQGQLGHWIRNYCRRSTVTPSFSTFDEFWDYFDNIITWMVFILQSIITFIMQGTNKS